MAVGTVGLPAVEVVRAAGWGWGNQVEEENVETRAWVGRLRASPGSCQSLQ